MTERHNWTLEERAAHQRELAARRAEWETQRKTEAEAEERHRLQTSLEAHLKQRGELWLNATGNPPTQEILARWQAEFVDGLATQREAEREAKIAEAEGDIFG